MEPSVTLTANKWQLTRLDRIYRDIRELKQELSELGTKVDIFTTTIEGSIQVKKINELKQTLFSLEQEAKCRKIKEKQLKLRRENLMRTLSELRDQRVSPHKSIVNEINIKRLTTRIINIDDELGPFRWYGKIFYLD